MQFVKYQALGNDYLIFNPSGKSSNFTPVQIAKICHRHYGLGSDGLLLGPLTPKSPFDLKIYNPDGSEAEKSGNGLRIFARYLWDSGLVGHETFEINTLSGLVRAQVHAKGQAVTVDMGHARLHSPGWEPMQIGTDTVEVCVVDIGNPHCVVLCDDISPDLAHKLGPLLENHPRFPNRTNVQFMQIIDKKSIALEIWERGAGYTLASGSSSCAAGAVAHTLGHCQSNITVKMPGGNLQLGISPDLAVRMTGPVGKVFEATLDMAVLASTPKNKNSKAPGLE